MHIHPDSLSPDPLYARRGKPLAGGATGLLVHPHACVRVHPAQQGVRDWSRGLDLFTRPPELRLRPDGAGCLDMVLDFGTELEGELELSITTASLCNVYISFGESLPEAETLGAPTTNPLQTIEWNITRGGRHRQRFAQRGFRFVRLQAHDVRRTLVLHVAGVHAWFAFRERRGDFTCSDRRFQRVWQTSVYTARLCTRPDTYWDGIKRDRNGWFGDARVIQETTDAVFHDPAPAAGMLPRLPTEQWTMGIPGFSFDAVAMLKQFILAHGLDHPVVGEVYGRVATMLQWARRTQTNRAGFIVRDAKASYFGNIAFVDWSPLPVGGKFEELSWLQCKHLEALRNAGLIARWMGRAGDADRFHAQAERLARRIVRVFWRPGRGMLHTLNQTTRAWEPLVVLPLVGDNEYRRRYFQNPPLGPSGASRHACALAGMAGLLTTPAMKRAALSVFRSGSVPPIITPYFKHYEAAARARCGDPEGAILAMRDYVGTQIEENDSATVWEWFEPEIRDLRRWRLGDWPKSLCHGWGSGAVPLALRHLLGVTAVGPGYSRVRIAPTLALPWRWEATVPTPHGPIRVRRGSKRGAVEYELPRNVEVVEGDAD
jgi:hypothetical protein